MKKKKKLSLSSFGILFLILIVLALISIILSGKSFSPTLLMDEGGVAEVVPAKFSTVVMATFNGFKDAIDICIFILILGGFLSIVNKTGALEAGIQKVVRRLNGNELRIIPVLMILFSIGGTTFGMAEETIPFYAILTPVMIVAGFDPIVSIGTVLLGSGAGVLGSTVNPFATGVAMDALTAIHIQTNTGLVIALGCVLWFTTTACAIYYVMKYAKKVKQEKGSTILSLQEQEESEKHFKTDQSKTLEFTSKHKTVLLFFAFTFIIMVVSLIPWQKFGIEIFNGWSSFLTGVNLGEWYFGDLAMWFLLMSIIIAAFFKIGEKQTITSFVAGTSDMLSVVLIIVVARGVSALMSSTNLDLFLLDRATNLLDGLSPILFVLGSYAIYFVLSFLIPSSSGLAYVTMPIMGGLAHRMGFPPEIMIMVFAATHGVINLTSPTSGILMGTLELNKVEYSTWMKFIKTPIITIIVVNLITLIISIIAL